MNSNIAAHGGNIYEAVRARGGGLSDFVDFSANINPLGLSPRVKAALIDSLNAVTAYPDPEAVSLKNAISECYRLPMESIETGNGAVELIYLLCRGLHPKRVLIPSPTFSEYEAGSRAAGVPVFKIPSETENFVPSLDEIARRLLPGDLLFFCNPNNPTGCIWTRQQLEPLVEKASDAGAHIVIDESFIDFRADADNESCRTLVAQHSSVSVLHSLTKFLAVPGLRLGFLIGGRGLVQRLKTMRDPWNVNVMAQSAGVAGLADREYRQKSIELINREKERMQKGLQSIPGVRVLPPSVNFVLADLGESGWDAVRLQAALLPYRILIRNCGNFDGLTDRYIRTAVRGPEENGRFLKILEKIMLGVDSE